MTRRVKHFIDNFWDRSKVCNSRTNDRKNIMVVTIYNWHKFLFFCYKDFFFTNVFIKRRLKVVTAVGENSKENNPAQYNVCPREKFAFQINTKQYLFSLQKLGNINKYCLSLKRYVIKIIYKQIACSGARFLEVRVAVCKCKAINNCIPSKCLWLWRCQTYAGFLNLVKLRALEARRGVVIWAVVV